jgi:two-component system sensor histidine kinase QseC
MTLSLKARLVALFIAALLAIGVFTLVGSYAVTYVELGELLDAHLVQTANLLAAKNAQGMITNDASKLPTLHSSARSAAFQIWHAGHTLVWKSSNAPARPLGNNVEGFADRTVNDEQWRVFTTWDQAHENLIQVGEMNRTREHLLRDVIGHMLAPLGVALAVLAALLWLAVGAGLRPLDRVATAVAAREPQRLDRMDITEAPYEVRPLVEQLNLLFSRIETSLDDTRRFTADAAHELRTPLAAIRAQAQVAAASKEHTERTHALQQVLRACDHASRLIEQLLTLARLDISQQTAAGSIALRGQISESLGDMAQTALDRQIELILEEGEAPVIHGNDGLLRILWRNLLDNAIRYSPTDSEIRVRIRCEGNSACIDVIDNGPGIAPEERQRVFDRFHRILGSGQPGSGLGLSIALRIAELHAGSISLNDAPGEAGLWVCVRLPRADLRA